jgi:hypothetical protein
MRSKIAAKMLKETPIRVRDGVRAYVESLVEVEKIRLQRRIEPCQSVYSLMEVQRKAWANMCIKRQARIEELEKENKSLKQKLKKK